MALPVLAAGATRVAAVTGRAAVGAGRAAGSAGRTGARTMRSASQMKSRFQQSRALDNNFLQSMPSKAQQASEDKMQDEENKTKEPLTAMRSDASRAAQFKSVTAMLKQFNAMKAATPEKASATQDAAQKAAKKMIPKAALFITNSIASAFELGTGGIALLLTFFIRFLTLGWYNVEMIYGGFIMKGRHRIIGPLSWDPIPMPFPKKEGANAIGPMILVLITDLFIVLLLMLPIAIIGAEISILASIF